jgi:arabinofuranosyltransferase
MVKSHTGPDHLALQAGNVSMNAFRSWLRRFFVTIMLAAPLAFYAWDWNGRPHWGTDDADIFLVYGQNLADGHGMVYNPGGEHVEGFTSFLYVLYMAPFFLVSRKPELGLMAANLLLTCASLARLTQVRDSLNAQDPAGQPMATWMSGESLIILAWVISSPAYVIWISSSLMDTAIFSSVLMLLCAEIALQTGEDARAPVRRRLLLLVALVVATRPEGSAVLGALLGWSFVLRWTATARFRTALVSLAPYAGVLLASLGGLTLFRLEYFGAPLPNTYYAKVSPELTANLTGGMQYFRDFFGHSALAALGVSAALIVPFAFLLRLRRRQDPLLGAGMLGSACAIAALATIGAPVLAGGDYYSHFRLIQPAWPLLAFPTADLLGALLRRTTGSMRVPFQRPTLALLALAAIPLLLGLSRPTWFNLAPLDFKTYVQQTERGRGFGKHMNDLFEGMTPPLVGVFQAGIKHSYDGPVFDLLGLNHFAMGHSPGDRSGQKGHAAFNAQVFFNVSPDVVLPTVRRHIPQEPPPPSYFTRALLKGLLDDGTFKQGWVSAALRRHGSGDPWLTAYYRRDWLRPVSRNPAYRVRILEASAQRGQ